MGDGCWPSTCTCTSALTSAVVRSSAYSAGKVVRYEVPSVSLPLTTWSRSATLADATSPAVNLVRSSDRLRDRPESPRGSWDTTSATTSASAARTTKIPGGRSSFRTMPAEANRRIYSCRPRQMRMSGRFRHRWPASRP